MTLVLALPLPSLEIDKAGPLPYMCESKVLAAMAHDM
jgi:hypothetical protein